MNLSIGHFKALSGKAYAGALMLLFFISEGAQAALVKHTSPPVVLFKLLLIMTLIFLVVPPVLAWIVFESERAKYRYLKWHIGFCVLAFVNLLFIWQFRL